MLHMPPTVSIEPFGLCSKYKCPSGSSIVFSNRFFAGAALVATSLCEEEEEDEEEVGGRGSILQSSEMVSR